MLGMWPVIIGVAILIFTYKRFQFTTLVYWLIGVEILVAMVSAHYGTSHVPVFSWLQEVGIFERNNFDKLGHFMQGFTPALITREILLRISPLQKGWMLTVLVLSVCLAISALYEILEWITVVVAGKDADEFLGAQGYIWDVQTDMAFALIGAVLSLLLLSRIHDIFLAKIGNKGRPFSF